MSKNYLNSYLYIDLIRCKKDRIKDYLIKNTKYTNLRVFFFFYKNNAKDNLDVFLK